VAIYAIDPVVSGNGRDRLPKVDFQLREESLKAIARRTLLTRQGHRKVLKLLPQAGYGILADHLPIISLSERRQEWRRVTSVLSLDPTATPSRVQRLVVRSCIDQHHFNDHHGSGPYYIDGQMCYAM